MATVILYSQNAKGVAGMIIIGVVIVVMSAVLLVALLAAGRLANLLGTTGINVLTRLMGLIPAVIAIEMIAGGLGGLFLQLQPATG